MPSDQDSQENPNNKVVPLRHRKEKVQSEPDPSKHPSAHHPESVRPSVDPIILRKVRNRLKGEEVARQMFEDDEPEPPTVA